MNRPIVYHQLLLNEKLLSDRLLERDYPKKDNLFIKGAETNRVTSILLIDDIHH